MSPLASAQAAGVPEIAREGLPYWLAGLLASVINLLLVFIFLRDRSLRHRVNECIEPLLGLMSGLKAFVAAVLGGIGSVPGAMAGGVLLGVVEEFVSGYTSSSYRDAIAFTVLILVLLVRPEGLFGKGRVEKV